MHQGIGWRHSSLIRDPFVRAAFEAASGMVWHPLLC